VDESKPFMLKAMKKLTRIQRALVVFLATSVLISLYLFAYMAQWETRSTNWTDVRTSKGTLKFFSGRSQYAEVMYVDDVTIYCMADAFGFASICPNLKLHAGEDLKVKYVSLPVMLGSTNLLLSASIAGESGAKDISGQEDKDLIEEFKRNTRRMLFVYANLGGLGFGFLFLMYGNRTKRDEKI
jgi:hypothetical protein